MRLGFLWKWIAPVVLIVAFGAAAFMYLLAGGVPARYQPVQLNQVERSQAARQFLGRIQDLSNLAQNNVPFAWSISQEEINDALASIDQIAEKFQEGKAAEVQKAMESSGVSGLAVALDNGTMSLMLHSKDLDKIISVDIQFVFDEQRQLRVRWAGTRVGELPIPQSLARDQLTRLQETLGSRLGQARASSQPAGIGLGIISADDIAGVVAGVIEAIDGKPLPTERTWPVNHKRLRIEGIDVDKGKLTLHMQPATRR